ncbi:chaperone SurA [Gemmobacter aquaticus]|uniref:Parvulin-like PPIase n=1 Tax=Gemmobacter aquaticus TaxID=490185 RepID=A0A918DB91_9RHOB|nr:peptidylprolyl isomerase [Gemmobacter aquaticus]GGO25085.1 chaperone SurA [Gemmobacter aquaticus]
MTRLLPLLTASLIALSAQAIPAAAQQNLFAPRIIINDSAVTEYEFQQRLLFMRLMRAPGDLEKQALDDLIADRLRVQEAARFGVTATEENVQKGMEEFAQRANMTAEQFLEQLGKAGVAPETFRDFVEAGVVWREIVRGRFTGKAKVSDEEIDRALEAETKKAALVVSIAELIIPANPGEEEKALALANDIRRSVTGEASFAAAVEQYSAAPSRERGGRVDPLPLANLPPQISGLLLPLAPGQVSPPMMIPGGVALFQLRSVVEGPQTSTLPVQVEYARLRLPISAESDTAIATVQTQAQTCQDLFGLVPGLPEDQLSIIKQTMDQIPSDVGLLLSRLDRNEMVVRDVGGAREVLMVCTRSPVTDPPIERENIRNRLANVKIDRMAEQYLATLRANAIIRTP